MSTDKPEVDFPGGDPPADLQITDIWEGNGSVANQGDTSRFTTSGSRTLPARNSTRAGTGASLWSSGSAPGGSSPAGTKVCKA